MESDGSVKVDGSSFEENNQIFFPYSWLPPMKFNSKTPRLALDMYVLAQGVKTGVYRVCDELFSRLIRSDDFSSSYFLRKGFEANFLGYIKEKNLPLDLQIHSADSCTNSVDILLSPFGVAPPEWRSAVEVLHAHIIYDLIAIHHPEFFTPEGAEEVRNIILSLDSSSVIFAISEYTKRDLLSYRKDLNPEQVTVIPLAAGDNFKFCENKAERAAMRARYGIPLEVPYLLTLATLEIRKNLEQVVRSYVRYMEGHPESNLHLVLSGMTGWKLEKLELALASTGAWRSRVVMTGYVDDQDLSALYSDALCFLYLSRYEGFGLPPLEAMACGTPVITSNNSSLPEVVGEAGLMFDADDIHGVSEAIAKMASSKELRNNYSDLAQQQAKRFSWDRCAEIVRDKLLLVLKNQRNHNVYLERSNSSEPSSANSSGPVPASFMGYENGSVGPRFKKSGRNALPLSDCGAWPVWIDRLGTGNPSNRIEGGLRIKGLLKNGTADQPLVSYVTVVRNNEKTLARTILSVQQQNYPNVEHIVLDGASTDGTFNIISKFADKLDYFASEPDQGLYDALNKAIPLSRGNLICVLNSDDWLEPDSAEIAVRYLKEENYNGLLLTAAKVVDGATVHHWAPAFVHPGSYFLCANVCHNAIYATRLAYESSGPYDISYKIAADFKWIMQCLDSGCNFKYTSEITVNYSLGGTSSDSARHAYECVKVVKDRFPFLSLRELNGLHHSFFVFSSLAGTGKPDVPENYTQFLREIFAKYACDSDFIQAIAWAGIINMNHQFDQSGMSSVARRTGIKHGLKTALMGYPRAHKLAVMVHKKFSGK